MGRNGGAAGLSDLPGRRTNASERALKMRAKLRQVQHQKYNETVSNAAVAGVLTPEERSRILAWLRVNPNKSSAACDAAVAAVNKLAGIEGPATPDGIPVRDPAVAIEDGNPSSLVVRQEESLALKDWDDELNEFDRRRSKQGKVKKGKGRHSPAGAASGGCDVTVGTANEPHHEEDGPAIVRAVKGEEQELREDEDGRCTDAVCDGKKEEVNVEGDRVVAPDQQEDTYVPECREEDGLVDGEVILLSQPLSGQRSTL